VYALKQKKQKQKQKQKQKEKEKEKIKDSLGHEVCDCLTIPFPLPFLLPSFFLNEYVLL